MHARAIRFVAAFALVALVAPLSVGAGSEPVAVIDFSSGDDVTVIRNLRKLPFTDPIGIELLEGDQVQTGRGVLLEIRLVRGGAIIKLAENTTFIIERMSGGVTTLTLLYGRIRAKVEKLAGVETFSVRTATTVAGVRGTDFGVDIVALKTRVADIPATRVYCFEGAVAVTTLVAPTPAATTTETEALEPVPKEYMVTPGEMVTVTTETGSSTAEETVIDAEVDSFWKANDFVLDPLPKQAYVPSPTEPAAPSQDYRSGYQTGFDGGYLQGYDSARIESAIAAASMPVPEDYLSKEESKRLRAALALQKGGLFAGTLTTMAGVALGGTSYWFLNNGGNVDYWFNMVILSGYIVAAGLPFMLMGIAAGP